MGKYVMVMELPVDPAIHPFVTVKVRRFKLAYLKPSTLQNVTRIV